MGDVDARVQIFTATALGRGRVASLTLGCLYPRGKPPVLILQEAEWTSGPVWTRRSEEKSPPLRHPGSNPGRPARSPAPCRLSQKKISSSQKKIQHYLHILGRTISWRWIGRWSLYITWPARSPDLTPREFLLWGLLRTRSTGHHDYLVETQERIYAAVKNVTPQMLHNTRVKVEYRLDNSRVTNGSPVQVYGT